MRLINIIGEAIGVDVLTQLLCARRHIVVLAPDPGNLGAMHERSAALTIHAGDFNPAHLVYAKHNVGVFDPARLEAHKLERLGEFSQIWVLNTEDFGWCMERGFDQVRFVGAPYLGGLDLALVERCLIELGL